MEYVKLGRTGLKVSRLCLGTAFRGYWHGQNDKATAKKTAATAKKAAKAAPAKAKAAAKKAAEEKAAAES